MDSHPARFFLVRFTLVATMLAGGGWQCAALGQDRQPARSAIQSTPGQYLILKTGSVYSGQLEFSGGKYVIHRNNGSSVRFNAGEVDFVTHSMREAYRRLQGRVPPGDVLGHQRLANWCLRNRQLAGARQQLAILKEITRDSAITRLLERQVSDLANPRTEQTPDHLSAAVEDTASGIRRLPRTESRLATRQELQATLASFSRESLREFGRSVHSRIVNGCAAARCHGDPQNNLQLWRVDNRGGMTSTGAQRNLHALSRFLDRDDPAHSPLLKYASQIHGQMEMPPYDPDSFHFHAIRDWVMISGRPADATRQPSPDVTQTSFVDQPVRSQAGLVPPSPVDLSGEQNRFVPSDEFDPEIFNRKFANAASRPRQPAARNPAPVLKPAASPVESPKTRPSLTRPLPPVEDEGEGEG